MLLSNPFTLHFATINTATLQSGYKQESQFTLHFATINTIRPIVIAVAIAIFTLHFATINTLCFCNTHKIFQHLHYILLLLILLKDF